MSDDTTESAREHADALVREHLARRGLRQTLAAMDSEAPRTQHAISSRVAVAKGLKMDRLVRRNKERDAPLASLLEMLCEALELNERPIRIEGGASNGAPTAVAAHALGAAAAAQPAAPALRTGAGARSGADAGRARALERDGANREAVARPEMLVMRDAGSAAAPSARFAAGGLGRADGDLSDRGRQPLDQAGAMLLDEDVGDVHDAYDAYGDVDARYTRVSAPRPSALPAQPRASLPPGVRARELGDGVAAELSLLFHGRPHAEWMASWARQGFGFSDVDALPFALRQRRGGTCGVIAAIQALLLRELLAASPPIDPLRVGREERQAALARALAGSLWAIAEAAAAERRGAHAEPGRSGNAGGGADCALASLVTFPARMALPPPRELGRAASVIDASSREQLEQCVAAMLPELQRTDGAAVIAFVYSAVLSAGGPAAVRAQIDSTGIGSSTLIGAHGYCTQELVNLVATGVALSNVFDGDKARAATGLRDRVARPDGATAARVRRRSRRPRGPARCV